MSATNNSPEPVGITTITRLLKDVGAGDAQASAELLPLVYEQLRTLAARKMQQEQAGQTLQATALVHEAYLRIVGNTGDTEPHWDGRWHFFAAAAEAMRRILVDSARRRGRIKRGGGGLRRTDLDRVQLTVDHPPDDLLALDEALEELATNHPDKAQLVKLRYFAGLTMEQAAEAMGTSVRTAGCNWAYARAWLFARVTSNR